MSLIKQLWLTILLLILFTFGLSLITSFQSSQRYMEQSIAIKNQDAVNALALTMSHMEKDLPMLKLLLAAQFDTGHYQLIRLEDSQGERLDQRQNPFHQSTVPAWFESRIQFEISPATAVVQDGWHQYGVLSLQSEYGFAYQALWDQAKRLSLGYLAAVFLSFCFAWIMTNIIRKPLHQVIAQAKDIGQRRFTTTDEPKTTELRLVVRAMNQLSEAVKQLLNKESQKIDQLRQQLQQDAMTGCLNRSTFMSLLNGRLNQEDQQSSGSLALIRFMNLQGLNQTLGRKEADQRILSMARQLQQLTKTYPELVIGRLNGSDFALLFSQPTTTLTQPLAQLSNDLSQQNSDSELSHHFPVALTEYNPGESIASLMSNLDAALAQGESSGQAVTLHESDQQDTLFSTQDEWHTALKAALTQGVQLAHYPVLDAQNQPLHTECPSRLMLANEWQAAGTYMPWIGRLNMSTELDLAVVEAALNEIEVSGQPLAVNISAHTLKESRFIAELHLKLKARSHLASQLWLEVPEDIVVQDLKGFRTLCKELQSYQCKVGLEHLGLRFTRLSELQDLGLSYIKFSRTLVEGVDQNTTQQGLLRSMATLCHSLGILAIAEGVQNQAETDCLFTLGMDGVTGPGVQTAR